MKWWIAILAINALCDQGLLDKHIARIQALEKRVAALEARK